MSRLGNSAYTSINPSKVGFDRRIARVEKVAEVHQARAAHICWLCHGHGCEVTRKSFDTTLNVITTRRNCRRPLKAELIIVGHGPGVGYGGRQAGA